MQTGIKRPDLIDAIVRRDFRVYMLGLTLTRRCNFTCRHCYRGPSQDFSISPETLDAILDEYKDILIARINLGGGEYCADVAALKMLADALRRKKIKYAQLAFVSNGAYPSKEFFHEINRIGEYSLMGEAWVEVSHDPFHIEQYKARGLDMEQCGKRFLEMASHYPYVRASVRSFMTPREVGIVDMGRATTLQGVFKYPHGQAYKFYTQEFTDYLSFSMFNGKLMLKSINFDAKGNICPPFLDWESEEKQKIGNIHTSDMTRVYLEHCTDLTQQEE